MRHFFSYGMLNVNQHYYAPRAELIEQGIAHLRGEVPEEGGRYFTVWGPRQRGKSWIMEQVRRRLLDDARFDVLALDLDDLEIVTSPKDVLYMILTEIADRLHLARPNREQWTPTEFLSQFRSFFSNQVLSKPLILILDEFDVLSPEAIALIARAFRKIYMTRQRETELPLDQKTFLLHGVAMIGIHSVLGLDNRKGSPFNVQNNIHIPNLTHEEVMGMFQWYQQESGRVVESESIDRLYHETQGQPGLIGWLGELLTQSPTPEAEKDFSLTINQVERALYTAARGLPNNTVMNLIQKAQEEPYQQMVIELFQASELQEFEFHNPVHQYLYTHGIIDRASSKSGDYVKFANPFVQKTLFQYFSGIWFGAAGSVVPPFTDLSDSATPESLQLRGVLRHYETYLHANSEWLFKAVPRRRDHRIYEAVFHFNLYHYLTRFLQDFKSQVVPEFPTGNGKIDLVIRHGGTLYGLELKTFSTVRAYQEALQQAARYGQQLGLDCITLVFFIESVDAENREKYQTSWTDETTGVRVDPVFVETRHD